MTTLFMMDNTNLDAEAKEGFGECTETCKSCLSVYCWQSKPKTEEGGQLQPDSKAALYSIPPGMNVNMKPLFNSMMYTAPHSMSVPMQNLPRSGTRNYTTAAPVSFQYIAQKVKNDQTTPFVLQTNEVSVFVCVMFLLGGLADLGLLSGFILEVEAQLIILSIVSFCVLEISHIQFKSYLVYCIEVSDFCEKFSTNFGKLIYMVSAFVDTAVFIFQVLFVITWVYTRNLLVIDHNFYPLFISLVVLVCFYMGLKFGVYVWKFADIFSTNTERVRRQAAESEQTWTARKLFYNFLALGEYLLYCSFIFVFFVIILYMLNVTDTPEKSLIFQEQTMYQKCRPAFLDLNLLWSSIQTKFCCV
jgi:hypothetical protein